jgi:hypothetical protein
LAAAALLAGIVALTLFIASGATTPRCTIAVQSSPPIDARDWGVWFATERGRLTVRVSDDGYLSVSFTDAADWQQFPHIRGREDMLCLWVDEAGMATLYINRERSWQGDTGVIEGWDFTP